MSCVKKDIFWKYLMTSVRRDEGTHFYFYGIVSVLFTLFFSLLVSVWTAVAESCSFIALCDWQFQGVHASWSSWLLRWTRVADVREKPARNGKHHFRNRWVQSNMLFVLCYYWYCWMNVMDDECMFPGTVWVPKYNKSSNCYLQQLHYIDK